MATRIIIGRGNNPPHLALRRTLQPIFALVFTFTAIIAHAQAPPAPGSGSRDWLGYWSFYDVDGWHNDSDYAPRSFTNLSSSYLGNWETLVVDSTNPAWLNYNINEADGTTNLTVDVGSVLFWFAPNWASTNQGGTGPGVWSRLIEVGSYTTNASYGWWSLYTDRDGANVYFASQTNNGSGATYLSAPISWTTNYWHFIALTYSASNSALYVDGQLLTNGPPISYLPSASVRSNGFWIGSDSNGLAQAHGMFDDVWTYAFPLGHESIQSYYFDQFLWFYANPLNGANVSSSASEPSVEFAYRAVTGSGYLTGVSNSAVACSTNAAVWMTNLSAVVTNLAVNFTFTIAGGSDGLLYDVFANTVLDFTTSTNRPWSWMGQAYHCTTYTLTNLPVGPVFLMLGTPLDSDGDGLTDAYERLVSKTRIDLWDSDGDGLGDGWEVQFGTNPLLNEAVTSGTRLGYTYDKASRFKQASGVRSETITFDREGNVQQDSQ